MTILPLSLLQNPHQFQMFISVSKGKKNWEKDAKLGPHELGFWVGIRACRMRVHTSLMGRSTNLVHDLHPPALTRKREPLGST